MTTAPGTAVAVRTPAVHNPQLVGDLKRKRISVVCACNPEAVLGVMGQADWTPGMVLTVQLEHELAVAAREKQADGWTRSVPGPPTVAEAVLDSDVKAGDGPAEDEPETKTGGAFK